MTTRLDRVIRAVCDTPWAILPEKLDAITELLELRANGGTLSADEIRARIGSRDDARIDSPGGIAVLPLFGVIAHRMNLMTEISGGTSTEQFGQWFDAALADPNIAAIVLDIDSPGGTVEGVEELAAKIYAARGKKPIIAHANSLAASAAYWIASACDEIVAIPSGLVGSIGVFTVHTDVSEMEAQAGVKRTVIRAGKYKADDLPFEPLDASARAAKQAEVDEVYGAFTKAVAKYRDVRVDEVTGGYGEGRAFRARKALAAGMVDRIGTIEQVIQGLLPKGATAGRARASATPLPLAASTAGAAVTALDGASPVEAVTAGADVQADRIEVAVTHGHEAALAALVQAATEREPHGPTVIHAAADTASAVTTDPTDWTIAAGDTTPPPVATQTQDEPAPMRAAQDPPAPQAKEQAMSEKTAAQDGAEPVEESREAALARLADIHGAHVKLSSWIVNGFTPESAQVQADIKAFYKDRETAIRTGAPHVTVGESNEGRRPWASFGEQLSAIQAAYSPGAKDLDPRLFAAAQGMNQAIPSEGGFTVAPQFSQMIWDGLQADPNSLLAMTDNYPVEGESLTFNANAETSRATGSRYGGVQGYWINEADQITKSKPKFRQVKVEPNQLAVLVYVTEKLLKNSGAALESYVSKAAGEEINFLVGDAIVNGDGVGKPKGILASACLISVAKETGQANDTIVQQNIAKMWSRLHPRSRANAVWLHNVDIEPQLDQLSTTVTNIAATENVGGYANKVFDPERRTLKGRPLVACEFAGTLGDVGDLILADMKGYLSGTRGGVETAMSMHVRFEYAEQAFRFMFEADGQPWLAAAQTPFKGTNTLSTFVTIAAR